MPESLPGVGLGGEGRHSGDQSFWNVCEAEPERMNLLEAILCRVLVA